MPTVVNSSEVDFGGRFLLLMLFILLWQGEHKACIFILLTCLKDLLYFKVTQPTLNLFCWVFDNAILLTNTAKKMAPRRQLPSSALTSTSTLAAS